MSDISAKLSKFKREYLKKKYTKDGFSGLYNIYQEYIGNEDISPEERGNNLKEFLSWMIENNEFLSKKFFSGLSEDDFLSNIRYLNSITNDIFVKLQDYNITINSVSDYSDDDVNTHKEFLINIFKIKIYETMAVNKFLESTFVDNEEFNETLKKITDSLNEKEENESIYESISELLEAKRNLEKEFGKKYINDIYFDCLKDFALNEVIKNILEKGINLKKNNPGCLIEINKEGAEYSVEINENNKTQNLVEIDENGNEIKYRNESNEASLENGETYYDDVLMFKRFNELRYSQTEEVKLLKDSIAERIEVTQTNDENIAVHMPTLPNNNIGFNRFGYKPTAPESGVNNKAPRRFNSLNKHKSLQKSEENDEDVSEIPQNTENETESKKNNVNELAISILNPNRTNKKVTITTPNGSTIQFNRDTNKQINSNSTSFKSIKQINCDNIRQVNGPKNVNEETNKNNIGKRVRSCEFPVPEKSSLPPLPKPPQLPRQSHGSGRYYTFNKTKKQLRQEENKNNEIPLSQPLSLSEQQESMKNTSNSFNDQSNLELH